MFAAKIAVSHTRVGAYDQAIKAQFSLQACQRLRASLRADGDES